MTVVRSSGRRALSVDAAEPVSPDALAPWSLESLSPRMESTRRSREFSSVSMKKGKYLLLLAAVGIPENISSRERLT